MKKNIYNTPKIKVKPIDSEDILAGTQSFTQNTDGVKVVDDESEAGSKSTSMFDTDTDNHWE